MKVLESCEKLLIFCGLFPYKLDKSTDGLFKSINTLVLLTGLICSLISPVATYMYQHRDDFSVSVNGVIPVIGGIAIFMAVLSIGNDGKRVRRLHDELQKIVDNGI